ncbi:dTDP-4-dehydrorhamnose reductase [Variovorax sp. YR752]|uniref:dTDP-4-dehydrorhamnose reductase n=1 Tax=Variovorax sp. YR752 TaxID=1884383 RepID=UPI003137C513
MRIVLFGSRGQLGWELQRALAPLGQLTALSTDSRDWPADFRQPESLAQTVRGLRPDVVVNAAAYTAVDRAESEADLAYTINATAPGVLAREAAALGATLLHYSTDYVFDGSGDAPRGEDAPVAPINAYGRSKLAGEEAVRASGCRHLILRTSWVFAARGGNFAKTMLRLAAERDSLRVVADQIGAPTGAELLADVSAHALRTLEREPGLAGTYHVAAAGETSWHAYACRVIDGAAARGWPLKLASRDIQAIATRDYPTPAARPLNSRLDTTRFRRAFGLTLPPWQQGVDRMLAELLDD